MTNANPRYRPEFEAALNALAPVFDRVVELDGGDVAFLAIEDIIADRMGQFHADRAHGDDMIGQARAMFDLAETIDRH